MKARRIAIAVLLLAALPVLPAVAVEGDETLTRLDQALGAVQKWEYGQDARPLEQAERIAMDASRNPAQRGAVEERVLKALGAATTRDSKLILCRLLRTVGTARAVPALEKLLTDKELSHMARYALGRIEVPEAAAALRAGLKKTDGALRQGVISTLADVGDAKAVPAIAALLGADAPTAETAAGALGRIGGVDAAKALEAARAKASAGLKLRLDDALLACADHDLAAGRKADAARICGLLYKPSEPKHIRLGALRGLVAARGAAGADLLVAALKDPDPEIQASAIGFVRRAEGPAIQAAAGLLPTLAPTAQAALLAVLTERGDASAASAATAAVKSGHEAVRVAALEALGSLGNAGTVDLLLEKASAGQGREQQAARDSLARLRGDGVDAALLKGIDAGDAKVRMERIRALASRGSKAAEPALRKAATDADDAMRREAVRALDAIGGEAALAPVLKEAADLAAKRQFFADLGEAGSTGALKLAEQSLGDADLSVAAGFAAIRIADRIKGADPDRAKEAVRRVLAAARDAATREKAEAVLNDLTKHDDHILAWLGAGPYEEKGKEAPALYDIAFPPEQPGAKVKWKKLKGRSIGPWYVDLEAAFGGRDNAVGYLRTSIWSPKAQDARLEMGSDDDTKAWLNGELLPHDTYNDSGLEPRENIVPVKLKEGWNDLIIKVVDHAGGWAAACRVRNPKGGPLEGLKYEANAKKK
jgi:HEAT repeat protein